MTTIRCGVCGFPMPDAAKDDPYAHPRHTDAELEPTKAAVHAAAKVLTGWVLLRMAVEAVDSSDAAGEGEASIAAGGCGAGSGGNPAPSTGELAEAGL